MICVSVQLCCIYVDLNFGLTLTGTQPIMYKNEVKLMLV